MKRLLALLLVALLASPAFGAASYPATVKSFTTKTTGQVIQAAHINDLQDEVVAIEQGLLNGIDHVFRPLTTNTRDLGTASFRWRDLLLGRTIDIAQGTITADTKAITQTATWNSGGTTFTNWLVNVTDTASAAASLLLDLQRGGSSEFSIRKDGQLNVTGNINITASGNAEIGTLDAFDLILKRSATAKVTLEAARVVFADAAIAIGTTPAVTGSGVRLPNGNGVIWRNAANTGDAAGIIVDSSDSVVLRPFPGGSINSHVDGGSNLGSASVRWATGFFSGNLSVYNGGTIVASAGGIRLQNNDGVVTRNQPNTGDITLVKSDTSNRVVISDQGNDIKWGTALIALGGGATPTFGTIGGTGPATAAQNSWMRAIDSTGAAFWVPVWK